MRPGDDLVEETVTVGDRELVVVRPRESEALLRDEAFEREELLPYWAELWPSGVALAREVGGRALRGARVLDLGCGLGVAAVAAALAGGRVLAADWSAEALAFTAENARRNGAAVTTLACDFAGPEPVVERGPWDLVLAADVLYERRLVGVLLDLLPRLVTPAGEVWLADPDRPPAATFVQAAAEQGWRVRSSARGAGPTVHVHRLRRQR